MQDWKEQFAGIGGIKDEESQKRGVKEIRDSPKFAYRLLFARRYTPLQKGQYASYLYILIYLKVRR